jgi:glycosyltransferase involved in cell wall biosynthesis
VKVVHINYDVRGGGASRIALSLHLGLMQTGIESNLITSQYSQVLYDHQSRYGYNNLGLTARAKAWLKFWKQNNVRRRISLLQNKMYYAFSYPFSILDLTKNTIVREADIVHLHLVTDLFDISSIPAISKPIVWTLHDFSPVTGGCPQPIDCTAFRSNCGTCPQLSGDKNYARKLLKSKKKTYGLSKKKIEFIAPSDFVRDKFEQSVFRNIANINVIRHGFSTNDFHYIHKASARQILNFPNDINLILVASEHLNTSFKGKDEVLKLIFHARSLKFKVGILGNTEINENGVLNFGFISSREQLKYYYCASDFTFVPSKAETFGNTVAESLLCGTPVIAFNLPPMNENIEHEQTGILLDPFHWENQIKVHLNKDFGFERTLIAHKSKERFSFERFLKDHIQLYNSIK